MMRIIKDKALLVKVSDADRITTAIKESKVLSESDVSSEVLVKWSLTNSRLLSNLGIRNPPSPILRDYDWPGAYKPYAHQKETASFLTANNRAFCFNSQGTGKTASVIWAADYLMRIGDVSRVLIVAPLSIMHSAWMQDIFSLTMHRTAAVAHGSRKVREKIINGDYEFVIINYDGIPIMKDALKDKFDLIVCDEASFVKNSMSNRWKALDSLITPVTKAWLLTGTPAAQSPLDAYGLAKLAVPQRVPRFYGAWRDTVMTKVSQFRWIPKPQASKTVQRALRPAIRFTKEQCLDLPPVTYTSREVPLTKQQEKYYNALKKQMLIEAAGENITAVHAAAAINKLLQISAGCVYSDSGDVIEFDARTRLDEMVSVVAEANHKTIVFVPFRHAIDVVTDRLRKEKYTVGVVHGGVSLKERTQLFRDFQESSDPHVLVIQPQSAAHGVTLTAADTIVWFGPIASVETWLQANERINRPSQVNKMTVVKLEGSPVEKRMYSVLESRETEQKALVAFYETIINGEI